jgi:hypothetical protein
VKFSARPEPILGHPPLLGENNDEIARELGFGPAEQAEPVSNLGAV